MLMFWPQAFVKDDLSQTHSILIPSFSWALFRPFHLQEASPVRVLSGNYARLLPQLVCHELVPGGKTIPVTDENK